MRHNRALLVCAGGGIGDSLLASMVAAALKSKFEAAEYKTKFERTERLSPFLVDPDKVKQAEDQRAMRIAKAKKFRHIVETPQ